MKHPMKHPMRYLSALVACLCVSAAVPAEVVELGRAQVTRYAVTEDVGGDTPLATGELVTGGASAVRLGVTGQARDVSLTLAEARSVYQLLGHMLAVNDAPSTSSEPTAATPMTQAGDEPVADPSSPAEAPNADAAADKKPFLGMNLAGVTYYSRAWVFTDLIKQSDVWRDDDRGYVFKAGHAPAGQYVCTWGGLGSIKFSGDAYARQNASNSATVTITSGEQGIDMQRVGEVTDVSLIRIEHEMRTSPFQPEFLDRLKPFKVLRFMDWGATNNSPQRRWSERSHKSDPTQAEDGVAIEYMIALCNELDADPWFCIPHLADDDYIRQFAELVRDRLHPDAKVYVEYSNEVWNSQFKQHGYIRQHGGGVETFSDKFFDAWAERCRNTFDIWSDVFGQDKDRLVRVAAVQLANPWVAQQLLPRLDGKFDAVSPSAYFGITWEQGNTLTLGASVEKILDLAEENIRTDNKKWFERHGELARQWSQKLGRPIRLIAYEAGQHLSANGDENVPYYDALIQAQSHPRIYGLYLLNMRLFEQAGGDLFVAFNDVSRPGKFGSWGHLEYQNQPIEEAPKYRALLEYPSMRDE